MPTLEKEQSPQVKYYYRNQDARIKYAINHHKQTQILARRILGGDPPKCRECGFDSDERVLHIDHINGGGRKERQHKSAQMIRQWIVVHPEEAILKYQLLCANCNYIKAIDNMEYKRGHFRKLNK